MADEKPLHKMPKFIDELPLSTQKTRTLVKWLPVIVLTIACLFFFIQWRQAESTSEQANDQIAPDQSQKQIGEVIAKISQLVLLPENEIPQLVTITDKSAIAENKEFFDHAENGDQVLIYQEARVAYLYRPDAHKLINMAPITFQDDQIQPASDNQNTTPPVYNPSPASVFLLNGTTAAGLTYQFQTKLSNNYPSLNIVDRKNAVTTNYSSSLIITLNPQQKALAQNIATDMNLTVSELPAGENRPNADFLIILGRDQMPANPSPNDASPSSSDKNTE